jgi:hypothetical protein
MSSTSAAAPHLISSSLVGRSRVGRRPPSQLTSSTTLRRCLATIAALVRARILRHPHLFSGSAPCTAQLNTRLTYQGKSTADGQRAQRDGSRREASDRAPRTEPRCCHRAGGVGGPLALTHAQSAGLPGRGRRRRGRSQHPLHRRQLETPEAGPCYCRTACAAARRQAAPPAAPPSPTRPAMPTLSPPVPELCDWGNKCRIESRCLSWIDSLATFIPCPACPPYLCRRNFQLADAVLNGLDGFLNGSDLAVRPARNAVPPTDLLDGARAHAQRLASLVDGHAEVAASGRSRLSCTPSRHPGTSARDTSARLLACF